jgi:hypothetical protein
MWVSGTPASLLRQFEHAKSDSNHWRIQNRDCHPPREQPLDRISGPGFGIFSQDQRILATAGRLLESHPPATKTRTVDRTAAHHLRARCGFFILPTPMSRVAPRKCAFQFNEDSDSREMNQNTGLFPGNLS